MALRGAGQPKSKSPHSAETPSSRLPHAHYRAASVLQTSTAAFHFYRVSADERVTSVDLLTHLGRRLDASVATDSPCMFLEPPSQNC